MRPLTTDWLAESRAAETARLERLNRANDELLLAVGGLRAALDQGEALLDEAFAALERWREGNERHKAAMARIAATAEAAR